MLYWSLNFFLPSYSFTKMWMPQSCFYFIIRLLSPATLQNSKLHCSFSDKLHICNTNIQTILQSGTTYFLSSDWSTWYFAHWRHQRAVTRFKNVHQLNIRREKKLGFQLSHRQPPNMIVKSRAFVAKNSRIWYNDTMQVCFTSL